MFLDVWMLVENLVFCILIDVKRCCFVIDRFLFLCWVWSVFFRLFWSICFRICFCVLLSEFLDIEFMISCVLIVRNRFMMLLVRLEFVGMRCRKVLFVVERVEVVYLVS